MWVRIGSVLTEPAAESAARVGYYGGRLVARRPGTSPSDSWRPASPLDGTTPNDERDAIIARLASGETLVVPNVGVLCEGFDSPPVKCAILARPTKSTGLYLQMAGRILRPWQDQAAIILDHAGCVMEHGLPQQYREFSLEGRKKRPGAGGGGPPGEDVPRVLRRRAAVGPRVPSVRHPALRRARRRRGDARRARRGHGRRRAAPRVAAPPGARVAPRVQDRLGDSPVPREVRRRSVRCHPRVGLARRRSRRAEARGLRRTARGRGWAAARFRVETGWRATA